MNDREPESEDRARQAQRRRRRAFLFGLHAESAAALWLQIHGYRILARRYVAAGGEIDLIAARGDVIAFVEVKARPLLESAMTSISATKIRRMSKAARHWLARAPGAERRIWRGDAVFLAPWRIPKHVRGFVELDIS